MTDNLEKQALVEMLREQLQAQRVAAQLPPETAEPEYWVVRIDEELSTPLVRSFQDGESLSTFLQPFMGRPGFCYVFLGHRCLLSVGSLPTLFSPKEIVPLFNVLPPQFTEDGSTVPPSPPQTVPDSPTVATPETADETPPDTSTQLVSLPAESPQMFAAPS